MLIASRRCLVMKGDCDGDREGGAKRGGKEGKGMEKDTGFLGG